MLYNLLIVLFGLGFRFALGLSALAFSHIMTRLACWSFGVLKTACLDVLGFSLSLLSLCSVWLWSCSGFIVFVWNFCVCIKFLQVTWEIQVHSHKRVSLTSSGCPLSPEKRLRQGYIPTAFQLSVLYVTSWFWSVSLQHSFCKGFWEGLVVLLLMTPASEVQKTWPLLSSATSTVIEL